MRTSEPWSSAEASLATGAFNTPRVPAFARELDERIVQLHSKEYRNPSHIQKGGVLEVSNVVWCTGYAPRHQKTQAYT